MKAVIIAAGMGNRLWQTTNKTPKTLLPFGQGTILSTIMDNLSLAGIESFVIVLGYKAELIESYLQEQNQLGYRITLLYNNEWQRGNGISVLKAAQALDGRDFLLSMADHLVSVPALQAVVGQADGQNLLLVDRRLRQIFDPDDATKVLVNGRFIKNIGKEIEEYNGVDCGIFRLTGRFFDAMRQQLKRNNESISDAVKGLIANRDMQALFMAEDQTWIDVDTPEAFRQASEKLKERFLTLAPALDGLDEE